MSSKKKKSTKSSFCAIKIKEEPVEEQAHSSAITIDLSVLSQPPSVKVKEEPIARLLAAKACVTKLIALKKSSTLNKQMRDILQREIKVLEKLLNINHEKQEKLKTTINIALAMNKADKGLTQIRAISVFAAPYFRDRKKMVPPQNEDTIIKTKKHDVNAYLSPPRPWTTAEHKKLVDGVTAYALLNALQPLKRDKDFIKRKMKDKKTTDDDLEELKQELYIVEQKIKIVNHKPLNELMDELGDNIDWMTVSATNMEGIRTPEECEIMWNNFLSFNINKEVFCEEEDDRLFDLAEDYQERNWDVIASALKTNRTAIQCFERYQTRLSLNLKKKYWTKEEDDRLIELIEEHKCGEIIPWNKISLLMDGRTRQQLINRYERSISQRINRAPWAPEEDGLLVGLYQKYGSRWNKMRSYFKRRSTYAIRERYCNALTPNIRVGPWSLEEDKLLIAMIRKYGYGRWAKICKKLPGRTDNMCLIRAGRLLEWSIKYHCDRGTKEFNPSVNDPEMFAKILRPCAPSKYCPKRNERLRSYRENGLRLLIQAMERILPESKMGIQDVNSVNISWMSSEMLHKLSDIMHENLEEWKKRDAAANKAHTIPPLKYITKPRVKRKRGEALDADEDDFFFQPLPEKEISREEKDLIDSSLGAMFEMNTNVMPPSIQKTQDFGNRQCAEMSLYKAYLYKQFQCQALCDEEDDLENVVFAKVDYRETLQTVVSYFIQPPVYDNQFIVLTPNLSTMNGIETIEATENRLYDMAENISHSKGYLDYLCERRKLCPQCLQCQRKFHRINSNITPETIMANMKKKSFLLDDRLEDSAYVEGASDVKIYQACTCKALYESRKSVQLLRKRFLSLFMWPALLSAAEFNQEQEKIICSKPKKDVDYFSDDDSRQLQSRPKKYERRKRKANTENEETKKVKKVKLEEPVSGSNPKPKRAQFKSRAIKKTSAPRLRRSRRSCVLNRTTFAPTELKKSKSASKTSQESPLSEKISDAMSSSGEAMDDSSNLSEENSCEVSSPSEMNNNDVSALPDESGNNELLLPKENENDNASILQNRQENINDTPASPDDARDSGQMKDDLIIPENEENKSLTLKDKEEKDIGDMCTLQSESSDSVVVLPEKDTENISGLLHEISDNVVSQEESTDSVLAVLENSENSSPIVEEKKEENGISALSDESRDSVLVLPEKSRDTLLVSSEDTVLISSEESNDSSPFSAEGSSDSVMVIDEKDKVIISEDITISSDSSVSPEQCQNAESNEEEAVANCVMELTEKSMCFR